MADMRAWFKDLLPNADWSSITGSIFNQGESDEIRAQHTVLVDENGPIKLVDSAPVTIIDNASFTETVTSADIDFKKYRHALLSIKTGTATNNPTLTVKLQIKDSNSNYIDHTTLTAISTATTVIEELFYLSAETIRVICTFGGSGNFASTTVELTMKS